MMWLLLKFAVPLILAGSLGVCAKKGGPRVYGGRPIKIQAAPYYAAIVKHNEKQPICGSTVISKHYAITVATCFFIDGVFEKIHFWNSRVVTGMDQVNKPHPYTKNHRIKRIFIHPNYDPDLYDYDVALLKVRHRDQFGGEFFRPLAIAASNYQHKPQSNLTVVGFGYYQPHTIATHLRSVDLQLTYDSICENRFKNNYTPRMMCVKWILWKYDSACTNDEGDPAVQRTEDGKLVLVGMPSHMLDMERCGNTKIPHKYTRLGTEEIAQFITGRVRDVEFYPSMEY